MSVDDVLGDQPRTSEQAVALFDSLDPVEIEFMLGSWSGEGFNTNHPMDGLLEYYQWQGKRFESAEHVHPLLFSRPSGGKAIVNPIFLGPALSINVPQSGMLRRLFQLLMPIFTTAQSKARLRITTYRGKSSATMIYDQLPINDVFRKIDDNRVLGLMDCKKMPQPFFFVLQRALNTEQKRQEQRPNINE